MKKFLSIIIIFTSLLLTSCASTTPTESTEISWKTSIISTTASAQEATKDTAGTVATASTTKSEPVTPQTPFVPSGYSNVDSNALETKSKVILTDFIILNEVIKTTYYYSKADGEFYPFCFDPFCDHNNWKNGKRTLDCVGNAILQSKNSIYYFNSRIYFTFDGTIYSCSEFASDLKRELVIEDLSSLTAEEYTKRKNMNHGLIIYDFVGDNGSLFFYHVNPDGKVVWYRYDISSKKLIDMTDDLKRAGDKIGVTFAVTGVSEGHIMLSAYSDYHENQYGSMEGTFEGDYFADFELDEFVGFDCPYTSRVLFKTNDGVIMKIFSYRSPDDVSTDIDPVGDVGITPQDENYDIVLRRFDGTTEMIIENAVKTFGFSNVYLLYLNDKCIYFTNNIYKKIGVEWLFWKGTTQDIFASFDGNVYRYDLNTKKIDTFFKSNDNYYDVIAIEYANNEENVAIFYTQVYYDKNNVIDGFEEYEVDQCILKCHLDSNGVVDGYEIVDFSEI